MDVGARKYRFRVLNAANYRDFRLQLSNGQAMTQIGTEAGLLPAPVSRTSILMGSAERVDLVIDFTGLLGQTITLQNTAATGAQSEIMQFRVNQTAADSSSVPASLRPRPDLGAYTNTRTFDFGFTNGHMTINGLLFDHHRVDAQPIIGTTESWIFRNVGGGKHTVHVHDVDQQLLLRNGLPPSAYELMKETWYSAPSRPWKCY